MRDKPKGGMKQKPKSKGEGNVKATKKVAKKMAGKAYC